MSTRPAPFATSIALHTVLCATPRAARHKTVDREAVERVLAGRMPIA